MNEIDEEIRSIFALQGDHPSLENIPGKGNRLIHEKCNCSFYYLILHNLF